MANNEAALFGTLLLRHRAAAGLTQEQLAARAGVSPSAIAALERGRRRAPRGATVELLARALQLDENVRVQFVAAARAEPGTQRDSDAEVGNDRQGTYDNALPALNVLAAPPATPLIDRLDELAIIHQTLTVEGARLLTLTGPAGVGKTRLALAAAAQFSANRDHFPDGVTFADLTPVRDARQVVSHLAAAIGLLDTGNRSWLERLVEALEGRQLVVLDNFEQVLPASAQLADLLTACPGLALLVTSRAPLQLRWERTLRVAPLPVPDLSVTLPSLDALLTVPSVELFVGRVRAHRVDFAFTEQHAPLVARVAAQLDGLPLALELAAARLDVLPLHTLARRLDERLHLLASEAPDMPQRHQSLEAAIGWSYDLLSEEERLLFRCLGVFVGRVSLDAITAVARAVEAGTGARGNMNGGETRRAMESNRALHSLLSLASKSLLLPLDAENKWPDALGVSTGLLRNDSETAKRDEVEEADDLGPEPAFGMLETMREFAVERLGTAGELARARHAHAHHFLTIAEHAEPKLYGRDQRMWFFWLEREVSNLRSALRWLLDQDGAREREAGLRLAGALGYFWLARGYHTEGRHWLEEALARAPEAEASVRARALRSAGYLLALHGDVERAHGALEEALTLAERLKDPAGKAQATTLLGYQAVLAGDVAEGIRRLTEALSQWEAIGNRGGLGQTQFYVGVVAAAIGDLDAAAARYTEALQSLGAAGDETGAGFAHCLFGVVELKRGNLQFAGEHVRAGVRISVNLRDRWLLSFAAQAATAVVGAGAETTGQLRLLGATDALAQAIGASHLGQQTMPGGQEVMALRERLARGEEEEGRSLPSEYQEGRSLGVGQVAALALRLLDEFSQSLMSSDSASDAAKEQRPAAQLANQSPLTSRERDVLRLVAQGHSSKEIGQQLSLSPSTVNQHVKAIFNKLGVNTRAQAVAVAAQRNLL